MALPFSDRWNHYFLDLCLEHSRMSKDSNTRVGSMVVGPDMEPRMSGFNGFPRGIADTIERLADRDIKNKLMVHAERNCICNAARIGVSLKGCTLFLACTDDTGDVWGGPPCTACTIEIIQAGITRIVSRPVRTRPSKWHEDLKFSRQLIEEAHIFYNEIPLLPHTDETIIKAFQNGQRI